MVALTKGQYIKNEEKTNGKIERVL